MYTRLTNKVIPYSQACEISRERRSHNQTIGFSTGVFDILHVGQALHLKSVKDVVDILVIGIDDDNTVKLIKGLDRPYFHETERSELLASLEFVDYVFIFKGPCDSKILSEIKPDYYGVSPHDPVLDLKKRDAKIAGVKLFISPDYLKIRSTSKVGRMIRFDYLLSTSPSIKEEERKGWRELRKSQS